MSKDALTNPFDRMPPHSQETEQYLLGILMLDASSLPAVMSLVSEDDFYYNKHRLIFKAIASLALQREPVDIVTVSEWLNDQECLDQVGGRAYINDLALAVTTIDNAPHYATMVRDKRLLRDSIVAGYTIASLGFEAASAQDALQEIQSIVLDLTRMHSTNYSETVTMTESVSETLDIMLKAVENPRALQGLMTGLAELDVHTNGLQKEDLIILAARPGMGKTALLLNIIEHAAMRMHVPCLFFSMEMGHQQLTQRLLASLAKVPLSSIRNGIMSREDVEKVIAQSALLGEAPILIDDRANLTPESMLLKAYDVKLKYPNLGLVAVDYLQLMGGDSDNRVQELSRITRDLKKMARELKLPIIALSQLSRQVENRQEKRPTLADLRDSGSIEQDADMVMFIYRDEYYTKEESKFPGKAEIIIAKYRNGEPTTIRVNFNAGQTKFFSSVPLRGPLP